MRNEAYGQKADDPVAKVLTAKGATVKQFVRLAVGEGIEKKGDDFASEVGKLLQ